MIIISHRGNLYGNNVDGENNPKFITNALLEGFQVEIDVWYDGDSFFLGHDNPNYKVDEEWLKLHPFWCHAKNEKAFEKMLSKQIHCFWHQTDAFTLTNRGIPWCYPNNWITGGITVIFEKTKNIKIPNYILGICVDNPIYWKCNYSYI